MPMMVEGLSCFGAFGSGAKELVAALAQGPSARFAPEVDASRLAAYFPARALRHMDHFSRMALLGARTALEHAGVSLDAPGRCGIILSSGYGAASPTFDFLDSVLDFGEGMASPLAFAHSVHNIPAALVAKNLQIVGPCATVCQIEHPVAAGLLLARGWLDEGRVERVLFGAVEETTPTLVKITERLVDRRGTERPRADATASRTPTRKDRPAADGAVFFCLSRHMGKGAGRIESISWAPCREEQETAAGRDEQVAVRFLSGKASPQQRAADGGLDGGAAYGNLPVSQAFDCVASLFLLHAAAHSGKNCRALCVQYGGDMRSAIALSRAGA